MTFVRPEDAATQVDTALQLETNKATEAVKQIARVPAPSTPLVKLRLPETPHGHISPMKRNCNKTERTEGQDNKNKTNNVKQMNCTLK